MAFLGMTQGLAEAVAAPANDTAWAGVEAIGDPISVTVASARGLRAGEHYDPKRGEQRKTNACQTALRTAGLASDNRAALRRTFRAAV
jgi:hypothetical protein